MPVEMLKPTQAAVVAGVELRDVNDVIDRRILPEGFVTRGHGRRVSTAGCMLITFYHVSAKHLTSEERRFAIGAVTSRLRSASIETLESTATEDWIVRDDFLQIDMGPFVTSTIARWKRYSEARDLVTSSADVLSGTPVIRGTRIPVHDVAASASAGHSERRILEAYPRLLAEQIELATLYVRANPAQGRPRTAPLLRRDNLISEERHPRRPRLE